jgi:putative membrane protein
MRRVAWALLFFSTVAHAHEGGPLQPDDLWRAWPLEPGILLSLIVPALLYWRGSRRTPGVPRARQACFWSGLAMVALALASPLHPLGEVLFSAHMAQHELLMMVAAPLLTLSQPVAPLLWGLPFPIRRPAGRVVKLWSLVASPFMASVLHAAALWVWHIPALFTATLTNEWVHTAQHLSFFVTALLFWWALLQSRGPAVLYIFVTAVHTSILGALLTFARSVIYPAYLTTAPLWGLTPLQDQQIGGLIMWIPAGVVYMAAALAIFWSWLRDAGAAMEVRRYAE